MESRYKNFWSRIFAATVDEIILIPLSFLIGYIGVNNIYSFIIVSFSYSFIYSSYFIYFHKIYGKTLGKKMFSIEVISIDEIHRISFLQSMKRDGVPFVIDNILIIYFAFLATKESEIATTFYNYTSTISVCALIWILIEMISMLFNKKQRALHDYLGKSVIIKTT